MDTTWFRDVWSFEKDTSWLHGFMKADAKYGVVFFAVLLLIGYLVARRLPDALTRVSAAVWSAIAVVVALVIAQPINSAVDRTRPFVTLHLHPLISHAADPGFPSDHATAVGAAAAGLWFVSRRLGAIATVLALLLAFSRVYVGVHYPGDVAGGLALGAVVAVLGALVVVPLLRRIAEWVASTRARPLVEAGAGSEPTA